MKGTAARRHFLAAAALGTLTAPWCLAQSAKQVRIGILAPRPLSESFYTGLIVRRLADLGYNQGSGMMLEYRATEAIASRYPRMARELVDLKCDVIFAVGPDYAVIALRDAQSPIPVVFLAIDFDPLQAGVVKSLSRPGSNITGVYIPQGELAAKRLEILREVLPSARRFLVFSDQFTRDQLVTLRRLVDAARAQLIVVEFSQQPYDYAAAFETARKEKAQALVGLASAVFAADAARISMLLAQSRLPSAGTSSAMAERGFLLSYGPDNAKITGRVAEMGVRILKGAKPAEIPVEQADEFILVVNGPIAKKLGVKIPESVMARATRIIT
jgi:putative tryptophan/tyrosine transport system substrate-binding protein